VAETQRRLRLHKQSNLEICSWSQLDFRSIHYRATSLAVIPVSRVQPVDVSGRESTICGHLTGLCHRGPSRKTPTSAPDGASVGMDAHIRKMITWVKWRLFD